MAKIRPAKYQLRERFDGLEELKKSIIEKGLLEPILVRPKKDVYEVVAGSRRYVAVTELRWKEVPATIRELTDKEAFEVALMENIQRRSMDPIEEAKAYKRYVVENGWGSQSELAKRLGLSEAQISERLKVLKLGDDNLHHVKIGAVSISHAETIASLDTEKATQVMDEVVKYGLDVTKTRVAVQAVKAGLRPDQAVHHAMTWPEVQIPLFKEKIDEKVNIREHVVLSVKTGIKNAMFYLESLPDGPEKKEWTTNVLYPMRQLENEALRLQKKFNNGKNGH